MYFPHAGRGQSTLVRLPPNDWIVVDANHSPKLDEAERNPALSILAPHAERADFCLIALILTHFHSDHYSGIVEILDLCEKTARDQERGLQDVLQTVCLPASYTPFYERVEGDAQQDGGVGQGHLRRLLERLEELQRGGARLAELRPHQFAWRQSTNEILGDEAWIFTFYPDSKRAFEEINSRQRSNKTLRQIRRQHPDLENDYSYLLEFGYGARLEDLRFLLMSDLPGSIFTQVTQSLRQEVIPAVLTNLAGCAHGMRPLIRRKQGKDESRLLPVRGGTVPHHGSGVDPVGEKDLRWWIAGEGPLIAIVQGGSRSLAQGTVDELLQAGLSVFATARPERLLRGGEHRNATCKKLAARMPSLPGEKGVIIEIPEHAPAPVETSDLASGPHLYLQGGKGLRRVIAQKLYEVREHPRRLVFHTLTAVYSLPDA